MYGAMRLKAGPTSRSTGAAREEAFRRLVDERLDASYRLAAVLLGDRMEAEDATHDAVVHAWRAFGSLRDHDRFHPWFQRIVVNACRDRLRQRRTRPTATLTHDMAGAGDAGDPAPVTAEREALLGALRSLNADQRIVIALRYYADLPIDEIARRLGQRTGTVKSRLHHAHRALRAAYDAANRSPTEDRR
jgi:RNA polymerase sigma-70 factor (ECF subfamily)